MKKNKFQSKDKKQQANIRTLQIQKKLRENAIKTINRYKTSKRSTITPDEGEHLLQYRQKHFKNILSQKNAKQVFKLDLDFGNYNISYSLNGRHILLTSEIGHVSIIDWKKKDLVTEFQIQDKLRAAKFLHTGFVGVAQKENLFIYDFNGLEIHQLTNIQEPIHLEYLPYHYLLTSITKRGKLNYTDVSTGQVVSEIKTRVQNSTSLIQNPFNSLMAVSSNKGIISFYTPNSGEPALKVLAHNAIVNDMAFTKDGNYMVTTGSDNLMKVFDIRKIYKEVQSYWLPHESSKVEISQTGIIGVNCKNILLFWNDWQKEKQKRPYLKHNVKSSEIIRDFSFVPYEDFLGLTFKNGFESILVPGSGQADFDTFEHNVTLNKKQMRENEVKKLLEKLPADTINLDPYLIGKIDPASKMIKQQEQREEHLARLKKKMINKKKKNKRRKMKDHIVKDIYRSTLRREDVRENTKLRKKMYKAEQKKVNEDLLNLNNNMEDILDLTSKFIDKSK